MKKSFIIFGILVKYKDGTCNINEASYYYDTVRKTIEEKIEPENFKKIDDYTFFDTKREITYYIRSIDYYDYKCEKNV